MLREFCEMGHRAESWGEALLTPQVRQHQRNLQLRAGHFTMSSGLYHQNLNVLEGVSGILFNQLSNHKVQKHLNYYNSRFLNEKLWVMLPWPTPSQQPGDRFEFLLVIESNMQHWHWLNTILANRMHDACSNDQIESTTNRYFNGGYLHTCLVSDKSRESGDFCAI